MATRSASVMSRRSLSSPDLIAILGAFHPFIPGTFVIFRFRNPDLTNKPVSREHPHLICLNRDR